MFPDDPLAEWPVEIATEPLRAPSDEDIKIFPLDALELIPLETLTWPLTPSIDEPDWTSIAPPSPDPVTPPDSFKAPAREVKEDPDVISMLPPEKSLDPAPLETETSLPCPAELEPAKMLTCPPTLPAPLAKTTTPPVDVLDSPPSKINEPPTDAELEPTWSKILPDDEADPLENRNDPDDEDADKPLLMFTSPLPPCAAEDSTITVPLKELTDKLDPLVMAKSPPFPFWPTPDLREISPPETTLSPAMREMDPPVEPEAPTDKVISPAELKLSLVETSTEPDLLSVENPVRIEMSPLIDPEPLDTSTEPLLEETLLPLEKDNSPPSP
jgi:hypothetical protein